MSLFFMMPKGKATTLAVSGGLTDVLRTDSSAQHAGVSFLSSGAEQESPADGGAGYSVSRGNWLDTGLASEVWLLVTQNSGHTLSVDSGLGVRQVLSTTRSYSVNDSSSSGGQKTANLTFDFYDAVSGGNLLDSVTIDITAHYLI